jgi:hypothetical protein
MAESELYAPVKRFLESQGFAVKGEVRGADVVALRDGEPPLLVIAELKLGLSFELILQAVDRLRTADEVWLAVPATRRGRDRDRRAHVLCRLLGIGLLAVTMSTGHVAVLAQPVPYRPRPNLPKRRLILREFTRRQGDPNAGGITRRTIMTAYRQQALAVAQALVAGPLRPRDIKGQAPEAGAILSRNYYGWFERVEKGVYALAPPGRVALHAWVGKTEGDADGIPGADGRVRP